MANPGDYDFFIQPGPNTPQHLRAEIEWGRACLVLPIPVSARDPRFRLHIPGVDRREDSARYRTLMEAHGGKRIVTDARTGHQRVID